MATPGMKKILLVEDELLLARANSRTVGKFGYEVVTTGSGESAVAMAVSDEGIDLILMDIDLGEGIDGPEAATRILRHRAIPIVFLTAHAERETVERVRGITRYGYVIKNSGDFVLRSSIEMAFELFDAHEAMRLHTMRDDAILEANPDLTFVVDRDGVFRDFSPRDASESLAIPADKIVGSGLRDLLPADEAARHLASYRLCLDTGTVQTNTYELCIRGSRKTYEYRAAKLDENHALAIVRDITAQARAEKALRDSERRFSVFMDYLPAFAYIKDSDSRTVYVNKAMDDALGASSWVGRIIDEVPSVPEEIASKMIADDKEALRLGHLKIEESLPDRDGEPRLYETRKFTIPRPNGETLIGGISIDITERARMEKAFKESEFKYRSLIEHSMDVIFCVDRNGEYHFVNKVFANTFGQPPEYFLGKTFWDVYPKEHADQRQATSIKVFETGESQSVEVVVPLPDRTLYFIAKANPVRDETGKVVLNLTHATDITDRKLAEEKVKVLLAEKELLLKEVHHRVKNNMSTMTSMLSLQSDTTRDVVAAQVLRDAEARLHSMGLLYDKLYCAESFSEMSMSNYIPALVEEVVGMFPNCGSVRVETEVADVKLGVKESSALGMLVNELITNSMKYAFAGREKGRIRVRASLEGGRVLVVAEDDGVGIPEGIGLDKPNGFGLQLVDMLTRQLGGTARFERVGGTRFLIDFPAPISV